ncbi:MAG: L-rhamnose mutarotase [Bacteroidales bacterium]|nr:L-rhamnose mutarotase [Bacteroidales bacterium]
MKRYCQTLALTPDPALIAQYIDVHAHVWPEVIEGQHEVGILSMQIYALGNQLFMIVDTTDDFDWERDMNRLAQMPKQQEWEAYVSKFQGCDPDAPSTSKWHLLTKIFDSES